MKVKAIVEIDLNNLGGWSHPDHWSSDDIAEFIFDKLYVSGRQEMRRLGLGAERFSLDEIKRRETR